jgi:hypothetical protein
MRALFAKIRAALRSRKQLEALAAVREKFNEEFADSLIQANRTIRRQSDLIQATAAALGNPNAPSILPLAWAVAAERDRLKARVAELEQLLGPRPLPGKAVR